jgi:hypothetical protein
MASVANGGGTNGVVGMMDLRGTGGGTIADTRAGRIGASCALSCEPRGAMEPRGSGSSEPMSMLMRGSASRASGATLTAAARVVAAARAAASASAAAAAAARCSCCWAMTASKCCAHRCSVAWGGCRLTTQPAAAHRDKVAHSQTSRGGQRGVGVVLQTQRGLSAVPAELQRPTHPEGVPQEGIVRVVERRFHRGPWASVLCSAGQSDPDATGVLEHADAPPATHGSAQWLQQARRRRLRVAIELSVLRHTPQTRKSGPNSPAPAAESASSAASSSRSTATMSANGSVTASGMESCTRGSAGTNARAAVSAGADAALLEERTPPWPFAAETPCSAVWPVRGQQHFVQSGT